MRAIRTFRPAVADVMQDIGVLASLCYIEDMQMPVLLNSYRYHPEAS